MQKTVNFYASANCSVTHNSLQGYAFLCVQNRGGLGITERYLNLPLSSATSKQSSGFIWETFLQFPTHTSKAVHGFKLLQGSSSCHGDPPGASRGQDFLLRGRNLEVMGRDVKTLQHLVCSPSGLLQE